METAWSVELLLSVDRVALLAPHCRQLSEAALSHAKLVPSVVVAFHEWIWAILWKIIVFLCYFLHSFLKLTTSLRYRELFVLAFDSLPRLRFVFTAAFTFSTFDVIRTTRLPLVQMLTYTVRCLNSRYLASKELSLCHLGTELGGLGRFTSHLHQLFQWITFFDSVAAFDHIDNFDGLRRVFIAFIHIFSGERRIIFTKATVRSLLLYERKVLFVCTGASFSLLFKFTGKLAKSMLFVQVCIRVSTSRHAVHCAVLRLFRHIGGVWLLRVDCAIYECFGWVDSNCSNCTRVETNSVNVFTNQAGLLWAVLLCASKVCWDFRISIQSLHTYWSSVKRDVQIWGRESFGLFHLHFIRHTLI